MIKVLIRLILPAYSQKKKKLNSIKHKKPNKISFLKPEFSSFRNYFFHKSTQHQKDKNTFINLSANLEENKNIILKGENFIERNKYFTDFVRINSTNKSKQLLDKKNWENGEKKSEKVQKDENNMKDNDINIEKLATKLNLFQNYNHCRNANLSKNNSFLSNIIFYENKKINNIKIEKENSNLLLEINKKNSLNHSFSNISKISSGTPNTRIYSGNIINNFNNVNINMFNFGKNKMNNIFSFHIPKI